jgi:nucleoside-diphosphate-sugar epimerase
VDINQNLIIQKDAERVLATVRFESLAGKSVLITGASGLLGTHLIGCLAALAERGQGASRVTAVVNSRLNKMQQALFRFPGLKIAQGDLCDMHFAEGLGRHDFIVHAAGYGQPGKFMQDQIKTLKLNTATTFALFQLLEVGGHFLFISTSEVYSGLGNPPYRENQIGTTNTNHARSCYIEGKRCGEAICNSYRARDFHANSARLALAYGPGTKASDHRVLNVFIERGLKEQKISLQDMGIAKRTYCYISDAVAILWEILLRGRQPVYNVGGVSRTTIAELAVEIGHQLGVPVEFPSNAHEMGEAPEDVFLDMTLVRDEFGIDNYVPLAEGLSRTIAWQKHLYTGTQTSWSSR